MWRNNNCICCILIMLTGRITFMGKCSLHTTGNVLLARFSNTWGNHRIKRFLKSLKSSWDHHFCCLRSQAEQGIALCNTTGFSTVIKGASDRFPRCMYILRCKHCWGMQGHTVEFHREQHYVFSNKGTVITLLLLFPWKKLQDIHTTVYLYFRFGSFACII